MPRISRKGVAAAAAFAPASVANVAAGFDVLGFAIDGPGDTVVLRRNPKPGLRVHCTSLHRLPTDPKKNAATVGILAMLRAIRKPRLGLQVEVIKGLPRASGMGSSAASAVAGVVAANALLGHPFSTSELLRFAMLGEQAADGAWHADNVAPALFGGWVLVRDNASADVVSFSTPSDLWAAVVHPHLELKTKTSRAILSKQLRLSQLVQQTGNLGALILALKNSNYALIKRSLCDAVIEPQRAKLIPGFYQVQAAALRAGALGASISGAGPSVFALARGKSSAEQASQAMQRAFRRAGLDSDAWVSRAQSRGAHLIRPPSNP